MDDGFNNEMPQGEAPRHTLRKREWWLVLLILIVFFTGLPGIFALPAERILFNPASYKQALAEENAYARFPMLLGQMIAEGGNIFLFGSGDRLLKVLQRSNYEAIVQQIFPETWVRGQADGLIDQFWAFFNFQSSQFRLVVDFRPIKERLSGGQSGQIAAAIVQGFPPCQGNDLLNWALQALNGTINELPLCQPPKQFLGAANLLAQEMLRGAAAAMPDALDLASVLRLPGMLGGQPVTTAWSRGFAAYHFLRRADRWLPWATPLLLIPVGFLARGTPRGPFYWLGMGLLLPGFVALIIALLVGLWSSQMAPYIVGRLFGTNLAVFDVLVGMLTKVTARFMVTSAEIALGVTLVGTILFAVGIRREMGQG